MKLAIFDAFVLWSSSLFILLWYNQWKQINTPKKKKRTTTESNLRLPQSQMAIKLLLKCQLYFILAATNWWYFLNNSQYPTTPTMITFGTGWSCADATIGFRINSEIRISEVRETISWWPLWKFSNCIKSKLFWTKDYIAIGQHDDYCNFTQFNRNSSGIIAQPIYMTLFGVGWAKKSFELFQKTI